MIWGGVLLVLALVIIIGIACWVVKSQKQKKAQEKMEYFTSKNRLENMNDQDDDVEEEMYKASQTLQSHAQLQIQNDSDDDTLVDADPNSLISASNKQVEEEADL